MLYYIVLCQNTGTGNKITYKCAFEKIMFLELFFLQMGVISPVLACFHFTGFEAKIVVFSWEMSANTLRIHIGYFWVE